MAGDAGGDGEAVVAAFADYTTRRAHQPGRHAFTDPRIVAAVAVRAIDLLSARNPDDIRRHLQPITAGLTNQAAGQQPPLAIKRNRWRTLTPGRQAVLLSALDPLLGPLDRLRYRTGTAQPSIACEPDVAAARARYLPQQLWPEWIVRLAIAHMRPARHLAVAGPCCLLVPANTQYPIAAAMAGLRTRQAVTSAAAWLTTLPEPHQSAVVSVLCRIAAYLDEHGSPIDYQRRREMISPSPLTWPQWEQLCFQANTHPGLQHRIRHARRYLYQLLTGADLAEDHGDLTLPDGAELTSYRAFTDWLPRRLRHALHGFAAEYLQQLDIDEPVTWSPPASCAAGLALPGHEPLDIDLDAVQQMLTQECSFGVIARRLGRSYDHVRYAAHHLITTPEPSTAAPNSPQAAHQLRERARELFTPAFLRRECLDGDKSLLQLEAETGIHRKLIGEYTRQAGIPTPTNRRRTLIDETWLREQHLNQRRSLTAIAADLGVGPRTVSRAAHDYGIPVRRNGGRRPARRPG